MKKLHPPKLTPGSKVGIVTISAPEPFLEPKRFELGVQRLQDHGYEIELALTTLSSKGYLASDERAMANDLNKFFESDDVKAIICSGGGTNANRLLKHLDFETIQRNPKIFMGVSNPTVLLNAVHARTGLVTFHGPTIVWNFGEPEGLTRYTESHLWPILEDSSAPIVIESTEKWNWWRKGTARGHLIGGNLASLQLLLGTPWEPNWEGAILFWEDIGKPTNRLDMALTHFRDAGVLDKIAGMIVGELVDCAPPNGGQTLENILDDLTNQYSFPILCNVAMGHTDDKITIPIGVTAELNSADNALRYLESGVQ